MAHFSASLSHPQDCKLLIFDLDGTLINSFADIERSLWVAFAAIDLPWLPAYAPLIKQGVSLDVFYEKALEEPATASPERFAVFVQAYRNDYNQNSENNPYEFAHSLLEELRHARPTMRLAIATTKPTKMARWVLEDCGLAPYFDVISGTDDMPHKPDPTLLHHVCALASQEVHHAMMVGDTDRDMGAAQAAPMTSIAICHGGWSRTQLETLNPSFLVDDLRGLHELLIDVGP